MKDSKLIIIPVGPLDAERVLDSFKDDLNPERHILISTMTGVSIDKIQNVIGDHISIVRIMPNTAVAICESMICLAADDEHLDSLAVVQKVFDQLGQTLLVKESLIVPAGSPGCISVVLRSVFMPKKRSCWLPKQPGERPL